jgi:two-component system OmpR family response regulator
MTTPRDQAALDAPRLLLVDDDREIRQLLIEQLRAAGYQVQGASDGVDMRKVLAKGPVDLIVLDLNLPGEDGLMLCREVRAKDDRTPIIMLTARSDTVDRIVGLEMGADDYLTKPFEPRELLARIRSVLRRTAALPANLAPLSAKRALFSGWTLDFLHRHLTDADGRVVILSGAEFRLLKVLIEHANRVLSREQLLTLKVVKQAEPLDRAIDLKVSRLRQKFGPDGATLIRTVRGEGYVLAAAVTLE